MSETLPDYFGTITPQMQQEVEEAWVRNRKDRIDRLNVILAECITTEELHMDWKYGDLDKSDAAIKSNEWVVVDLGNAGKFIPIWQFDTVDLIDSKLTIRPEIAKLWSVGNHNGRIFCQIMTQEWRNTGKTPLDLINEGNEQIIEDIDYLFRYPPGM